MVQYSWQLTSYELPGVITMIVGVVGYRFDHYSYIRNIIGKVPGVEYSKTKDLFAYVNAAARTLNQATHRQVISTFDLNNQFYDFNLNKINLLHLYNGISYGSIPWVSTFETILPRFRSVLQRIHGTSSGNDWKTHIALQALASHNCKQLIAMSRCAANFQLDLLAHFDRYRENIEGKMVVIHPPQHALVSHFEDKHIGLDERIKFMFLGHEFFRKGGREIIETFKLLRDQFHYDIELIVVSELRKDDYVALITTEEFLRVKTYIEENREWIVYYSHLPNPEVLQIMKQVHIGLLPTYADSYGYSVLEFQAAGCPVISTNVRALPEINNNRAGWVIEVPRNQLGEAIYSTEADRSVISKAIREGLVKAVCEIFENRAIVPKKSEQAILNIQTNHSLEKFSTHMKDIYLNALS